MLNRLFKSRRDEIICPGCGRRVRSTDRFCGNCAHRLGPGEAETIFKPPEEVAAVEPERKVANQPAGSSGRLWIQVCGLKGRTLRTLHGKPFDIVSVDDDYVMVVPQSSGKPRPIRRQEVEKAHAVVVRTGRSVTSSKLREAGASDWNPVYVLAILKAIGVTNA